MREVTQKADEGTERGKLVCPVFFAIHLGGIEGRSIAILSELLGTH